MQKQLLRVIGCCLLLLAALPLGAVTVAAQRAPGGGKQNVAVATPLANGAGKTAPLAVGQPISASAVGVGGAASAWGDNSYGQLGNGSTSSSSTPMAVSGMGGISALAAGFFHNLTLKSDGTVYAWGANDYGQLGNGALGANSSTPAPVSNLSGVVAIAAGYYHNLALSASGKVYAWGRNDYGQLGNGSHSASSTPVQVSNLSGVVAIAGGGFFSLALKSDGSVYAWGANDYGQLGNGALGANSSTPAPVSNLSGVVAIAGGGYHGLALKSDGSVYAWGANFNGELGNGSHNASRTPVQVSNLSGVVAIAGGGSHSMALKSDGSVYAWGANSYGQLGIGESGGNNSTPVAVSNLSGVVAIAAGFYHSLALKSDGTVHAWGRNGEGQLGNGEGGQFVISLTPVQVSNLGAVVAIAGGGYHSLALRGASRPRAWGYNGNGQLGDGATTNRNTPVAVNNLSGVVAMAGGAYHSLALKSDGTVYAWGANDYGQLGNGSTTSSATPVQVSALSGVVAIAGAYYHSLALKSDGTVWAWGRNDEGQLGNGTTTNSATPAPVSNLSGVVAIAGGYKHSLALKRDGTVWSWGDNGDGQLGNGTYTNSATPVQVSNLSDVVAISGGVFHSLAVKSDGTVMAWGDNGEGQLGNGTTTSSATPVQVSALSGVVAVAGAYYHSLALKSDGTVWAWGDNGDGQLGNGTYTDSATPVQVSNLSGVVALSVGASHGLALKSDGTVWAWGVNGQGQLGNGAYTNSATPVQVSNLSGAAALAGGDYHSLGLVDRLSSSVSLGSSRTLSAAGQSVTITATVSASVTPTGTVTFFDGANQLGAPVSLNNGVATLTTASLSAGSHLIYANYSGNAELLPSAGNLFQYVNAAPANVSWIDAIGVTTNDASITRGSTSASWSAGATSNTAIAAGFGYAAAQVGHAGDSVIFGLGNGNDDQSGNDIDFGIYFNGANNTAQASEFNALKGAAVAYTTADTFKVAIELQGATPVVNYYKNSTLFFTNTRPTLAYPLRLDTALFNAGSSITNAVISAAYSTTLSPRTSGAAGTCSAVDWKANPGYTTNVTINSPAGAIQKTGGANNAWNAGDSSSAFHNLADAPLSVQGVVSSASDTFIIGLSKQDNGTTPADTDFGIYGYGASGLLKVAYKGTVAATIGTMAAGDVIRAEYNATQARFYKNNTPLLVITYPGGNQFFPAIVDSTFYNLNAKLNNVQICTGGTDPVASVADLSTVPHITVGQQQQLLSVSFSDVKSSDYFYEAAQYLASHGAVSGYSDNTFRPAAPVTRGQLAKMVVVASGEPLRNPNTPTFSDTPANSPFYQFIETAVWLKMVNGYSDGTFRPNNEVTRGQLAKMVVLGMSIPLVDSSTQRFSDVSASNPFASYIATALQHNMISGYSAGSFRPGAGATRAQVAKIIFTATQNSWDK